MLSIFLFDSSNKCSSLLLKSISIICLRKSLLSYLRLYQNDFNIYNSFLKCCFILNYVSNNGVSFLKALKYIKLLMSKVVSSQFVGLSFSIFTQFNTREKRPGKHGNAFCSPLSVVFYIIYFNIGSMHHVSSRYTSLL